VKKHNKRFSKTKSINDLTSKFFHENKLGSKLLEKEIGITWTKIMDKLIVDRTNGIYCKDLNVFVKINSSPLKNELNLSKEKILQKLKKYHKKIKDIIFL